MMLVYRTISDKQYRRQIRDNMIVVHWLAWISKEKAISWGRLHGKTLMLTINIPFSLLKRWPGHEGLAVSCERNVDIANIEQL